jgi:hypothetical protein
MGTVKIFRLPYKWKQPVVPKHRSLQNQGTTILISAAVTNPNIKYDILFDTTAKKASFRLPSHSLFIIILSLDTVQAEILTASLNKYKQNTSLDVQNYEQIWADTDWLALS